MTFLAVLMGMSSSMVLGTATTTQANPIKKVVTLMKDMVKEIEAEGEKEKELFDKFMCYCQGSSGELDKAVADAQFQIKSLASKLDTETSEKLQMSQELATHKAD